MRMLTIAVFVAASTGALAAQTRSAAPVENTPFAKARTAFLVNEVPGQAAEKPFAQLRRELRKWDRFDVAREEKLADITISLGRVDVLTGASGPALGNTAGSRLLPAARPAMMRVASVTVRQRATGAVLWAAAGDSIPVLVTNMRRILPPGPKACVAFWCW